MFFKILCLHFVNKYKYVRKLGCADGQNSLQVGPLKGEYGYRHSETVKCQKKSVSFLAIE